MSDISLREQMKFERLFSMDSGYVLDFSNRTFQGFVLEGVDIDIYDEKFNLSGCSKANRLRAFWKSEPNHIVGKLLLDLLEYWKERKLTSFAAIESTEQSLFDECYAIADRLFRDVAVENVNVIRPYSDDKDYPLLVKSIKESIKNNEPEIALDRLHTFVVKYIRQLCDERGIAYDRNKPLHGLFGEYVKLLKSSGVIESEMTERILKSSISLLEAFNDVRNNQSLAHDNPVLNYHESVLISSNVLSAIKFLESIENRKSKQEDNEQNEGELPF